MYNKRIKILSLKHTLFDTIVHFENNQVSQLILWYRRDKELYQKLLNYLHDVIEFKINITLLIM